MKYKLIKAIDTAGLSFLTPVVLLCYGDEPAVQVKKIIRFIVVPAIAIALFIGLWFVMSDKIKTKSGELPNPKLTTQAADSIWDFHVRENAKAEAYLMEGLPRERALSEASARLAEVRPMEARAQAKVDQLEQSRKDRIEAEAAELRRRVEALRESARASRRARINQLKADAATLPPGDRERREAYLQAYREHEAQTYADRDRINAVKDKIDQIVQAPDPDLEAARAHFTLIAEERQFLDNLVERLSESNRAVKTAEAAERLEGMKAEFFGSADGPTTFRAASQVLRAEPRLQSVADSEYAKPYTLPMQIIRSIFCVFVGFVVGAGIAIPIGILCGLSKTFMAAMTPFIAIFKPVSPIIWVIVFLIIVGGFIPDPDKHWLMELLWEMPLIGWMKINPAFIASALTVAMCSLWATLVNTALGVASIEKEHMDVARVLRLGFWSRLHQIVIPASLPLIFAGLRISLGIGWMVLIAAELLASSEGIGKFVWDQFNNGASDSFAKIIVTVFVVGSIGLVLDRIMIVFQRLVSFDGAPTAV